ncbi:MAG: LacI family DNA-binding transcriptional regulator [Planctomycetota bacterium]
MSVTIQHIAERVGVSKQAVSYALNNKSGQVSPATRKRIISTAHQMGYRPNWRARSFARKRSQIVGLVYGRPADYVEQSDVVSLMVERLAEADHELLLIPAMGPVDQWAHKLRDGRIDGCVVTHPLPEGLDTFIAEHSVPAVLLNLRSDADVPQVSYDDRRGTRLAMDHLLGLGHRRIAYYCKPKEHGLHYSNLERQQAYVAAMSNAGLSAHAASVIEEPEPYAASFASRPAGDRPTALLAYNDHDAFYLARALNRRGCHLPRDLSLVCFNDGTFNRLASPRMTAVSMSERAAVHYCVDRLLGASDAVPGPVLLPQELKVYQTTAPCPPVSSG